ncbi:MAG: HP1 family phage holin [Paenalcaligenes sp.]
MTRRENRAVGVQEHITDAAVASAATKYGMGGGLMTSVFGWLSSNGAAVLIGIAVTILGFIVNGYYQRKRFRLVKAEHDLDRELKLAKEQREQAREERERELHAAQLAAIKGGCEL